MGTLSGRSPVGHRARGLLRDTAIAGRICRTITRAAGRIAGARTACSASAIASAGCAFRSALWNGKDPILKERLVRADRARGQSRRGRQGALLLPRRDADELVLEGALQVSASGVPVRAARRGEPRGAASSDPRIRARGHRRVRSRLLGRVRRVREGRPRRHLDRADDRESRHDARRRCTCCRSCGCATRGRGAVTARATIGWARSSKVGDHAVRVVATDARPHALSTSKARRSCCSPTTRPTSSGCSDRRTSRRFAKDAFHRRVVGGEGAAVNPAHTGTKCAAWYVLEIAAGARARASGMRLTADGAARRSSRSSTSSEIVAARRAEADHYHRTVRSAPMTEEERRVVRQADAGLVWSRKFYHYIVEHWQDGDPSQPPPPPSRKRGRNRGWEQLWARDIISMPDGWEYPWFAAWDLAFHCVAQARFDPQFAKHQLLLLMREWYMHPNGQLPAYEFAFGDVNPPVHAWAVWRIYQLAGEAGHGYDREFLERAFDKCLINFTWWVNREDAGGDNLFTGGFLGLDNIGIFDRSQPLPGGGELIQADATAWMAFYCTTMLAMGARAREGRDRVLGSRAEVLRALRRDRARDQHDRRRRPVVRGRRLLLRSDPHATTARSSCGSARWSASCRCSRRSRSTTKCCTTCRRSRIACGGSSIIGPSSRARSRSSSTSIIRTACSRSRRRSDSQRVLEVRARRERVPVAVRACARCRAITTITRTRCISTARTTRSTTRRARSIAACSAATRTGAARSGCRSTTC